MKLLLILFLTLLCSYSYAQTYLINENFDDQAYESPLAISHIFGGSWSYDDSVARGGSGYSVKGQHDLGDLIVTLTGAVNYLDEGVYFRYWVYYEDDYTFHGDQESFENLKVLKIGGGGDGNIEFIYKNSGGGGPSDMQLYWNKMSTGVCCGGTGASETDIFPGANLDYAGNDYVSKGIWHKIEIYLKLPESGQGNSICHVQVDDSDVYDSVNADILGASDHTGSEQFVSIRAGDVADAGNGDWWVDDVIILHDQGDLCDNEPGAGGGTSGGIVIGGAGNLTIGGSGYIK